MERPEMIFFDYGQTLIVEPQFDLLYAEREVMKHAVENRQNYSAEEVAEIAGKIFNYLSERTRADAREIDNKKYQRLVYDYLEIKFDITYNQVEQLFWDSATHGSHPCEGAAEMLEFLHGENIRTGVISNLSFSRPALETRINRYLPNNYFELFIASSDYIFRKPNKILFDVALKRAKISPDKVFYCGDNVGADIVGAHGADIFPVLYTGAHMREYNDLPDFDFWQIDKWDDFCERIKALPK